MREPIRKRLARRLPLVVALLALAGLLPGRPATACFGPKLHVGIARGVPARVLAEVVILYVKEKTGIESKRLELGSEAGDAAIAADRIDLAVAPAKVGQPGLVLALTPAAAVIAGPRPREDLQFTTVMPALEKLAGLFGAADLQALVTAVRDGRTPAAAAREFLQQRRWI